MKYLFTDKGGMIDFGLRLYCSWCAKKRWGWFRCDNDWERGRVSQWIMQPEPVSLQVLFISFVSCFMMLPPEGTGHQW